MNLRSFLWQNVGWVRFELTTSLVRFSRPDTTSSGLWVPCSGKLSPASRYTMPPLVVAVSSYLMAIQCPGSSVSMQDKTQFLDCVLQHKVVLGT